MKSDENGGDVFVGDYGQPSLTSEYQVDIEVIDINDCAPKFTERNYRFRVWNDTSMETFLGEVRAIDEDYSPEYRQIRYEFLQQSEEEKEIIALDRNNGSLYLLRFPSREIRWNLIVLAIDQENQSLFDQATIEIIFDYHKPCVWKFSEDLYVFNTTEHQPIPYEIGIEKKQVELFSEFFSWKFRSSRCYSMFSVGFL